MCQNVTANFLPSPRQILAFNERWPNADSMRVILESHSPFMGICNTREIILFFPWTTDHAFLITFFPGKPIRTFFSPGNKEGGQLQSDERDMKS